MVIKPMIIWYSSWFSIWSSIWSNMWSTNLIFLKANKPYFHYYQTCHYQLAIIVTNHYQHWLNIFIERHCHYYYHHHYLFQKILVSANQFPKLMHELILFTSVFLRLVDKYKEKNHIYHYIGRALNEAIKERMTRYN